VIPGKLRFYLEKPYWGFSLLNLGEWTLMRFIFCSLESVDIVELSTLSTLSTLCFITLIGTVVFKLVILVDQRTFLQSAIFHRLRGSFQSSRSSICGMLQVEADVKQHFPLICGEKNQLHNKVLIVFMNVFIRRKP